MISFLVCLVSSFEEEFGDVVAAGSPDWTIYLPSKSSVRLFETRAETKVDFKNSTRFPDNTLGVCLKFEGWILGYNSGEILRKSLSRCVSLYRSHL